MKKILKKIVCYVQDIIADQKLHVIRLTKREAGVLQMLYVSQITHTEDLVEAMGIIYSSHAFWSENQSFEFVLFGREMKALAQMCNRYCMEVVEVLPETNYMDVVLAEAYEYATNISLKLTP